VVLHSFSVAKRFSGGLNKDNLSRHFQNHVSRERRAELMAGPAKVEELRKPRPLADDKPIEVRLEMPTDVHRDLVATPKCSGGQATAIRSA
jgi:hypothetical protein